MDRTEQYLKEKNIDVVFNALGATEKLVDLFIQENNELVKNSREKISNYVKHTCYNKYYQIDSRTKFTGFEKFNKLDRQVRAKMNNHIKGIIGKIEYEKPTKEYIFGSYLEELKNSFRKFNNPLLYLSGGIDSEFVALTMLDAGIKFTPIIFQWGNDQSQILNLHDIYYALDFCNDHNLQPIIRTINLEKLWNNPEFELLAKQTQNASPQVNTYVYMIEQMAEEFKDSTHVLGGEVRFRIATDSENKISNYVSAAKVSPTGYNGNSYLIDNYVDYTSMHTGLVTINLVYSWDGNYGNNQTWNITGAANGVSALIGSPSGFGTSGITGGVVTGNWFNADLPGGTGWDYRTSYDNGATYTGWNTLGVGANIVATLSTNGVMDSNNSVGLIYVVLDIRSKSNLGVVVSSSFSWRARYDYFPTLATFTGNGTFTPPAGITNYSVVAVGGGGGGGGASRLSAPGSSGGEYNGAAGGGGAGGLATWAMNIPYTSGSISFVVANGGAGGVGYADGSAGGTSSFTLPGGTTYTASGGGGGLKNPDTGTRTGGNGGSNSSYTGGAGQAGPSIEESYGGGGAGAGGNGTNSLIGGGGGDGGPAANIFILKNSAGPGILYGGGGEGGYVSTPFITADPPGYGGSGGGLSVYFDGGPTPPTTKSGNNGGPGRVYIYY